MFNRHSEATTFKDGFEVELKVGKTRIPVGLCNSCEEFILREIPGAHLAEVITSRHQHPELADEMDRALEGKAPKLPDVEVEDDETFECVVYEKV